ncbi:hypothetical protein SARC_17641, partial [Sphaeroforma arctica JP610]
DVSAEAPADGLIGGPTEAKSRSTDAVQLATEFVVGGIMVHVCRWESGLWGW